MAFFALVSVYICVDISAIYMVDVMIVLDSTLLYKYYILFRIHTLFAVYILDDILASLDVHVANHVVKYCILGMLKSKTRVIVTESQTLYYYASKILRVEDGHIGPSHAGSNSIDNLNIDDEQNMDDISVPAVELNDDGKRSVDSVLMEESKEYGTLSPRVFRAYWKATGSWIGLLVILSVIAMQATKNFSDAWLAHWIADINPSNSALTLNMSDSMIITPSPSTTMATNSSGIDDPIPNPSSFYVLIYAVIALTNSAVTLFRAFIFAYAGIKAAKSIHVNLLQKVIYVRNEPLINSHYYVKLYI